MNILEKANIFKQRQVAREEKWSLIRKAKAIIERKKAGKPRENIEYIDAVLKSFKNHDVLSNAEYEEYQAALQAFLNEGHDLPYWWELVKEIEAKKPKMYAFDNMKLSEVEEQIINTGYCVKIEFAEGCFMYIPDCKEAAPKICAALEEKAAEKEAALEKYKRENQKAIDMYLMVKRGKEAYHETNGGNMSRILENHKFYCSAAADLLERAGK